MTHILTYSANEFQRAGQDFSILCCRPLETPCIPAKADGGQNVPIGEDAKRENCLCRDKRTSNWAI